jgi:hypothetical protein
MRAQEQSLENSGSMLLPSVATHCRTQMQSWYPMVIAVMLALVHLVACK